jgi:hypothetical protein
MRAIPSWIGSLRRSETGQKQVFPISGISNLWRRIASVGLPAATIVAVSLFLMSACTIAPYHSLESEALPAPENNISQLAANDAFNQCHEQTGC